MTLNRHLVIPCIVLCFILQGCNDPETKKLQHYTKALEYEEKGEPKAAIIELKNAIQIDARFADARYQLGLLYLNTGNPKGAFEELQRAASLDVSNLDAGVKVAEFFLLSRKNDDARRSVEQVLSIDGNYLDGLALLANLELIEGNFAVAETTIDKALAQAPENDKLYNIKGRILGAQEKWAEAELMFKKAIEFGPDNYANYHALLMFYRQKEDEDAMQDQLDAMLVKFPDTPQLHIFMAELHQKKGALEEAEAAVLRAIAADPTSVSYRLMLNRFYKKNHQYDKAEEALRSALTELPDEIQLKIALADLLFDSQNFEEAEALMESVLAVSPGNGGAQLIKARFLIRDNKDNEALEIITPLLTDYPKWAEPYYFSALTHLRLGKPELALKAVELAIQNDPSNDRSHALAAQIHLVLKNNNDAGREASIALKLNQRNFVALKILTKSLVQAKEYDKALQLIDGLNDEVVLNDIELLGSLGVAHIGADQKEQARETFVKLLELAPDNAKALAFLTALTAGKDTEKSIAFIKNYISTNEYGGHYLLLGDLYVKNKQNDKALEAYEKAQTLRPDNPRAYLLSARLLSSLGKTGEAVARYEALLEKQPDSIAGLMGLATAHEVEGRREEAKAGYKRVLELQPDLPAASNNLAWLIASEEDGDLGEALRLAMQAKQAMPTQPHIADTLGWVHYKRNSYALAITQFRQALENRPDDPIIQYHLALALHGNGETAEAKKVLEKALSSDTPFSERGEAEAALAAWK